MRQNGFPCDGQCTTLSRLRCAWERIIEAIHSHTGFGQQDESPHTLPVLIDVLCSAHSGTTAIPVAAKLSNICRVDNAFNLLMSKERAAGHGIKDDKAEGGEARNVSPAPYYEHQMPANRRSGYQN